MGPWGTRRGPRGDLLEVTGLKWGQGQGERGSWGGRGSLTDPLRDPRRQPHTALRLADTAARRQPHARPERGLGPQQPQHALQVGLGGSLLPGQPPFGVPFAGTAPFWGPWPPGWPRCDDDACLSPVGPTRTSSTASMMSPRPRRRATGAPPTRRPPAIPTRRPPRSTSPTTPRPPARRPCECSLCPTAGPGGPQTAALGEKLFLGDPKLHPWGENCSWGTVKCGSCGGKCSWGTSNHNSGGKLLLGDPEMWCLGTVLLGDLKPQSWGETAPQGETMALRGPQTMAMGGKLFLGDPKTQRWGENCSWGTPNHSPGRLTVPPGVQCWPWRTPNPQPPSLCHHCSAPQVQHGPVLALRRPLAPGLLPAQPQPPELPPSGPQPRGLPEHPLASQLPPHTVAHGLPGTPSTPTPPHSPFTPPRSPLTPFIAPLRPSKHHHSPLTTSKPPRSPPKLPHSPPTLP